MVCDAACADPSAEAIPAHVDQPGDVDGGILAGGELAPGVEDLSVGRDAGDMAIHGRVGTRHAIGQGHGHASAVRNRVCQLRGVRGDERRGIALAVVPQDEDDVGIRVGRPVHKAEDIRSIAANPDPTVPVIGRA